MDDQEAACQRENRGYGIAAKGSQAVAAGHPVFEAIGHDGTDGSGIDGGVRLGIHRLEALHKVAVLVFLFHFFYVCWGLLLLLLGFEASFVEDHQAAQPTHDAVHAGVHRGRQKARLGGDFAAGIARKAEVDNLAVGGAEAVKEHLEGEVFVDGRLDAYVGGGAAKHEEVVPLALAVLVEDSAGAQLDPPALLREGGLGAETAEIAPQRQAYLLHEGGSGLAVAVLMAQAQLPDRLAVANEERYEERLLGVWVGGGHTSA